jgi:cold-inducible RNA-binding protein
MNQNRLFVGNLAYQTIENDLQEYFSQAGQVTSVNLMLDKFTGKSRGFAFVEFASDADAQKAVDAFHGKDFQGRALTVNIARPREERAPRREFGGGGSGGGGGGGRREFREGGRRERY